MAGVSSMNTEPGDFTSLIELIGMQLSTATVLFHQAVADRLGANATDMKAYTVLTQAGKMTAGELAGRLGLTTGAITSVVDRLESAGLVGRTFDPRDRRRVVIELQQDPEREREVSQLYEPMGQAVVELVTGYSDAERATILEFINSTIHILEKATKDLRAP